MNDSRSTAGSVFARVGGVVVGLLCFLLLPGAVLGLGAIGFERYRYAPRASPYPTIDPAAPRHDPDRPTAVVVVGNGGADVADVLVPYEILAETGAFNLYLVAPQRRPVTLLGGLDVMPQLSFAELDQRLRSAPDVTVVPELPGSDVHDRPVIDWLRETGSDGLVLGVCSGARLVAAAGLLDGREATSHWYRLGKFRPAYPDVRWRLGTRYVDAGEVITTGALLSAVDGTLRVVERLLGEAAAAEAATAVGWRHYSPGRPAQLPRSELTAANAGLHLLNIGFRSNTTKIAVLITDGVGEIELASAFAPYAEIRAARTVAVGEPAIRSRHGLTFLPRAGPEAIGSTDRLLVPGREAATMPAVERVVEGAGVPVSYLHTGREFAFAPALRAMAASTDVPTARWAGKILEYSTTDLGLSGPPTVWKLAARPLLLGLIGLAVAIGAAARCSRVRAKR